MRRMRFFTDERIIKGASVLLKGSEARHLIKVLRRKEGDKIIVFDGCGMEGEGKIVEIKGMKVKCIVTDISSSHLPSIVINLLVSIPRIQNMEWLVEKASELGVKRVIPIVSSRSRHLIRMRKGVDVISSHRIERWRKIALSASKQCGRVDILEIADPVSPPLLLECIEANGVKIILTPSAPKSLYSFLKVLEPSPVYYIAVGPEGGWEDEEVSRFTEAGFIPLHLGMRILKTESASFFAVSIIQAIHGDMGDS